MILPFQQILLINLHHRTDRLNQMMDQGIRTSSGESFTIIEACTPDKAIENSPFVAFNTSQLWALKALHTFPALVLEDDCVFGNCQHLEAALGELPSDWEILYGGANLLGIDVIPFKQPVRYSQHLFTVTDAWQTHCMIYSRRGAERILDTFKVNCGYNMDEWLRQNILPAGKSFVIAPQIAYQRAGYSDIWNCQVQTEHLFEQGNKLLL